MGVAARKRAEQFYGMTTMLGDYRDLYNELAGKPSARIKPAPPAPVAPAAATPPPASASTPSPRRPKGLP